MASREARVRVKLADLPEIKETIARLTDERDEARAAVERVRELCAAQGEDSYVMAYALRRALDGAP